MALKGNKYGTHRVIEPKGVLTQAAYKIDNDMTKRYSNEIICDVISLNIDSASFTQIDEACGHDVEKIGQMIMNIVAERGKQQNPVTGSGGMFIGKVAYIGEDLVDKVKIKVGDKIASLVSLSLTPLKINKIKAIHPEIDRVDIEGQAVLFESGIYAKLPDDMSEALALAALDVAAEAYLKANELNVDGKKTKLINEQVKKISDFYQKEALFYINAGKYALAAPFYNKAGNLAKTGLTGDTDSVRVAVLNNCGEINKAAELYDQAIEFYNAANEILPSAKIYGNIYGKFLVRVNSAVIIVKSHLPKDTSKSPT